MIKVLWDNQATLRVFKNEALVSNIRTGKKTSIGMSTVIVYDILYVGVEFFNEKMWLPTSSLGLSISSLEWTQSTSRSTRLSYTPLTQLGGSLLWIVRVCMYVTPPRT